MECEWYVSADFNNILSRQERNGLGNSSQTLAEMNEFKLFIDNSKGGQIKYSNWSPEIYFFFFM